MIWNDRKLREWAESGGVTPFDPATVNPASVDLRWSGKLRRATYDGWSEVFDVDSLLICQEELLLLDTVEYLKIPVTASGVIALKSSIGRLGLEHLHAGFFDPGFEGTATLEVTSMAPWPVTIVRNQRLVQIVLSEMIEPPEKSYRVTGRYNGQREPEPTR